MASVHFSQQVVVNVDECSTRSARIEAQVDTVMVEAEGTGGALPTTSVIPVMEQVLEFEVVGNPRNKTGKLKARARAKAKEKPTATVGVESVAATTPTRKSLRVRQPPAKFRNLAPRPFVQQAFPPLFPAFLHPLCTNGLPPMPLPHNLMVPFPPIPVSTTPANKILPPPAAATAVLHMSTFLRINDQSQEPSSTSAANITRGLAAPGSRRASPERYVSPVANKRRVASKKMSPHPNHKPGGNSQSSCSRSQGIAARTMVPSSLEAISVTDAGRPSAGSSTISMGSTRVRPVRVASSPPWLNVVHGSRSYLLPYVSSNSYQTSVLSVETGAAINVQGRSAKKPPLPPNASSYRKKLPQNPPYHCPPVLERSFAHIPPPPDHDGHPMVPPRASLNNRKLGFPKVVVPFSPVLGKSQVVHTSPNPQGVPGLVSPQRETNQGRIPDPTFSLPLSGMNITGQTRCQQKRRMRQLKTGIGKKFQNLTQGVKVTQEQDSKCEGDSSLKQIVLTDEQRMRLVNDMVAACRTDPKFRAKYLDAVKQLSHFGVLQTASYKLISQGPSRVPEDVVHTWKNQSPIQEASTSASIKFYRAVNKVHEGVETMQRIPGSCSVGKNNDGIFILPGKKRKLGGEERPPTNCHIITTQNASVQQ